MYNWGWLEPGGRPSVGSHRVGHGWSDLAAAAAGLVTVPRSLRGGFWWCSLACLGPGPPHTWGSMAQPHPSAPPARGLRIPEARPRGAWWEGRVVLSIDIYLEKQSIRDGGKRETVGWIGNFHSALPHHQALRILAGPLPRLWASLVAQTVNNLPVMREAWVGFLGWEDPLEKGTATHSSILAWRIPRTEEPGELQSMGSQRVGHNWTTFKVRYPGLWGLRFMETWVFGHRERLVRMASEFRPRLG